MKTLWVVALIPFALTGCAVGPDYVRPEVPVPAHWSGSAAVPGAKTDQGEWWKHFDDPELNRLVAEALSANLDLKQAQARILDARAQRIAALAAGLPGLDARANYSRRRNSFTTSGATGSGALTSGGGAAAFGSGRQIIDIFQMGFDASWELDLFGGVQRAVEAAEATMEAELENRRALVVTLLGEIVRYYIDLRTNQHLLSLTRRHLEAQQETLVLTRSRYQAGLASELEVAQQESQRAALKARLPGYEVGAKRAIHALAVLMDRDPGALWHRLQTESPIPRSSSVRIDVLPSELLQRRPDIRRAERQLASATAQIGVATSELYPKINLAAFLGLQNTRITDFSPIGKSWSMASSLSIPIFNWGRLRANVESKEAQRDQALWAYRSTILTAFREVEDALVAYAKEQERLRSLEQSVEASRLAVHMADERYRKGLTSFLDVLAAQQALYEVESQRLQSEAQVSSDLVALYKALGGGWQAEQSTAVEPTERYRVR